MKKKGIIIAVVVVVVLAALGIFFLGSGKEEGYRMMQVYQISGKAMVERENVGTMDAFENLNLITGDKVEVAEDSYMRLKVDDDKYVLAEAGSVFKIYAMGSTDNGRTNIELEKGAVTVEVQNKLSDDASFEVTTPNSVMAVRGTVFRISLDVDEAGEPITKIAVFEGEVSVQKKDENGNLSKEQSGKSGNEIIVYEEVEELQIKILGEISFTDIPVEVLEFLQEITERRELSITSEEIKELIDNQVKTSQDDGLLNDEAEDDESQNDTSQDDDSQDNKPQNNKPQNNKPQSNKAQDDGSQSGKLQNDDSQNDDTQDDVAPDDESQDDTVPDDESQDDAAPDDESQNDEPQDNETVETTTYTVTFTYQGNVFATQVVEAGKTAKKPTLMPAKSGNWMFDFTTPIEDNIVIKFEEQ